MIETIRLDNWSSRSFHVLGMVCLWSTLCIFSLSLSMTSLLSFLHSSHKSSTPLEDSMRMSLAYPRTQTSTYKERTSSDWNGTTVICHLPGRTSDRLGRAERSLLGSSTHRTQSWLNLVVSRSQRSVLFLLTLLLLLQAQLFHFSELRDRVCSNLRSNIAQQYFLRSFHSF